MDIGVGGKWPFYSSILNNHCTRIRELFENGKFTDITITFPDSDITYDAHRLILAITSPVFEGILYGPMRTESRNVELNDDDPLIMKYIIAYCYGVYPQIPDMDTALELYKLADKYFLGELKNRCAQYIVSHMSNDNIKDVMKFAERFNFSDLKSNCLPYLKSIFRKTGSMNIKWVNYPGMHQYPGWNENDPNFTFISTILRDLNDDWIDGLLPEVVITVLDFTESWKHPENPIIGNRLRNILLSRCYLDRFYGCISAAHVHQFPLEHTGRRSETLELCLSVTDPHHARRVIEAINQQQRFEKHLIALHIRSEKVWPSNWSSIPIERTHRPSILLISNADDDKIAWVIEAAKALLPQSEGSYTKVFTKYKNDDDGGYKIMQTLKPDTILKLPRCSFTLQGRTNLLQGLITSGVNLKKIVIQSPCIVNAQERLQFNITVQCLPMNHDLFRKVFEDFTIINSEITKYEDQLKMYEFVNECE